MPNVADEGLGLLAGLNVIPKCSLLAHELTYELTHARNRSLSVGGRPREDLYGGGGGR